MKTVVSEGVREIWLSSEDTGAYGNLDPPFILEHLKEIAAVLRHPCVYSFLHVPVQSGSDSVLTV